MMVLIILYTEDSNLTSNYEHINILEDKKPGNN